MLLGNKSMRISSRERQAKKEAGKIIKQLFVNRKKD